MNPLALALAVVVALAAPAAYLATNTSPTDAPADALAVAETPAPPEESASKAGRLIVRLTHAGLPDASRLTISDGSTEYRFLGPFAEGEVTYELGGVRLGKWMATLEGTGYMGSASIDLRTCAEHAGEVSFDTRFGLTEWAITTGDPRCVE